MDDADGPSVIANLLRKSPPESAIDDDSSEDENTETLERRNSAPQKLSGERERHAASENTPLLGRVTSGSRRRESVDPEDLKTVGQKRWFTGVVKGVKSVKNTITHGVSVTANPKRWDPQAIWQNIFLTPASCLPSVAVGLLLNILDALSYGQSPVIRA